MRFLTATLALLATPALAAAGEPFFSLRNTNLIVLAAFLVFIGILLRYKVPAKLAGLLDARAAGIRSELAEAKAIREEARALLASYDQKQREVQEQSSRIVASAKEEAQAAADQAKADLTQSIARRLAAADDQIGSAVKAAETAIRDRAISVAVAAAGEVLARQMTAEGAKASIDAAITQVEAKLH
jgi:F-type H+-transporting ATPase subunit b